MLNLKLVRFRNTGKAGRF